MEEEYSRFPKFFGVLFFANVLFFRKTLLNASHKVYSFPRILTNDKKEWAKYRFHLFTLGVDINLFLRPFHAQIFSSCADKQKQMIYHQNKLRYLLCSLIKIYRLSNAST